jgi:hypothetical protein
MPFKVHYWRGSECRKEIELDWIPEPYVESLLIMIDPIRVPYGWVHTNWLGHQMYLSVPQGSTINGESADDWKSDSDDSDALYPWWWNLCESYSNNDRDVVLLILPDYGETSEHYHDKAEEVFYPVDHVGSPSRILHGWTRESGELINPIGIKIGIPHKLIRNDPGYSVVLLLIKSPIRFPDRSDHFGVDIYV